MMSHQRLQKFRTDDIIFNQIWKEILVGWLVEKPLGILLSISYLGINAVVLVTSGAGLTDSTGFNSKLSAWLIHRSGGFSSLCFFFVEPLDCITCL